MDLAGPRGIHAQGRGCLGESHGWAVTSGRTRASVRRTPRPGALCASRAWTWGTPDRTSFPPQGNQGPPPKRPHYCSSGRHQEPIRILGQHSGSSGRNPKSGTRLRGGLVKPDSERLGSPRRLDQSLKRAGEEAPERPWPQDGKRRCWCGKEGSRCTHHGPDQGCQSIPVDTRCDGPRPGGTGLRHPARGVSTDACSPGEGRAIRCPVAGRARKGVGGGTLRLQSTARVTLISAGHSMRGPGSDNPRAGRGSEG